MKRDGTVTCRRYPAPPINLREVHRYLRVPETNAAVDRLLQEAMDECLGELRYDVCYAEYPVEISGDLVDLSFARTESHGLATALEGCERAVVFAATVGLAIDRRIARDGAVSPARALCTQAIGAERIEALCDAFCKELAEEWSGVGASLTPRFSPGYGDLSLEFQRDIFAALDCPRRIGLTLGEGLLMSPTKSVTAICGIKGMQNTP